ncbi:5695_t:CDS:2, partial [Acaulospora colombiana]
PSFAPSTATSEKKTEKQENLVGKINNFISTDLGNITEARDILFMVWYTPLQVVICVAILGMGVLIISIPIPSLIGTMLNRVQTELMNVLRMIKLFAWETRVKQKVLEKREDELLWTKKRQLLQLLNMNA